jgi:sarcosine oxidase
MTTAPIPDVAVIGAGVFGAWIVHELQRAGRRAILVDAYGPANSRSSSGGESRIIRMGYGVDEIYTRWSQHSLPRWQELCIRTSQPLFHRTGVLWIARGNDSYAAASLDVMTRCGVSLESIGPQELRPRYPQITFDEDSRGILEPESGVLMARRAVHAVIAQARVLGVEYLAEAALPPAAGAARLDWLGTASGGRIHAGEFIFACGPWLPKLFPALLGNRIFISRQEVYFFGAPPGDTRFASPALPTWLFLGDGIYGMPDLESRGLKISLDRHGPPADPDSAERSITPSVLTEVRHTLAFRFPALRDAPLVDARVCQYENTSSGDFLVDRHPDFNNVWLVGGGSGHGFKHGPAMGEYVADLLAGRLQPELRFSLSSKLTQQHRAVY